jgi:hypothetical protein
MGNEAPKHDTRAVKPKRRRPSWLVPLIIVVSFFVLSQACSIYFDLKLLGYSEETYRKRIAPKHAKVISTALNKYFAKHGRYPEYLFGGTAEDQARSLERYHWGIELTYTDPLLEEKFLSAYPRYPFGITGGEFLFDPRSMRNLKNVVITGTNPLFDYFILQYKAHKERLSVSTANAEEVKAFDEIVKYLMASKPLFTPGGIASSDEHGNVYSAMPLELNIVSKGQFNGSACIPGHFGYVRGEEMVSLGLDDRSAFLWFYAQPSRRAKAQGLDVLNAETGELKPDGIPDGIVLLYELREGKVVKTTRAEDM